MCNQDTAERILEVVKNLPEPEARKVLRFAEYLNRPVAEDRLLEDFILTLTPVSAFQGEPVELQETMRREWD
ncbi:MAG: hypothetical protein AXA67_02580 [Methylothermaceae bacteria B42]|nr:MAG: hypothetical protein AXA67_02580 [Methylothermaceae bacteria B42]HHJ38089.1 DUF2281 domain-containing protein [Methylothermaceae bacterium]